MQTRSIRPPQWLFGALAALAFAPSFAADANAASPEAKYQKERAACLSGQTNQARETCLKEAGAALAEARRNRLDNGEQQRALTQNALQRCRAVPAADRSECERMAMGEGTKSGSVEGGGVIKELVTIVPGEAPAAPAPTPPKP